MLQSCPWRSRCIAHMRAHEENQTYISQPADVITGYYCWLITARRMKACLLSCLKLTEWWWVLFSATTRLAKWAESFYTIQCPCVIKCTSEFGAHSSWLMQFEWGQRVFPWHSRNEPVFSWAEGVHQSCWETKYCGLPRFNCMLLDVLVSFSLISYNCGKKSYWEIRCSSPDVSLETSFLPLTAHVASC